LPKESSLIHKVEKQIKLILSSEETKDEVTQKQQQAEMADKRE